MENLELNQKVNVFYTRFHSQYGFYEQPWYSAKIKRFTKRGNPVVDQFVFDKKTGECVNFIGSKGTPDYYRKRRIKSN